MEAAEQTIGYQPKPDKMGYFDDECHKALEEKNALNKKWIDRPARAKRMEYERLGKIAHKICKNRKRTHIDKCIRDIEGNNRDKQIRNAFNNVVSLKLGFQPHMDLCKGTNKEILSKEEEIKTRWKTYFQDLFTSPATAEQNSPLEATYTNQADT